MPFELILIHNKEVLNDRASIFNLFCLFVRFNGIIKVEILIIYIYDSYINV